MNKKPNTERQTQESKTAECEKAVSLRHGLYALMISALLFSVYFNFKSINKNEILEQENNQLLKKRYLDMWTIYNIEQKLSLHSTVTGNVSELPNNLEYIYLPSPCGSSLVDQINKSKISDRLVGDLPTGLNMAIGIERDGKIHIISYPAK